MKKKKEEITEETVTESVKSSSRKITIQIKSQLFTIGKKKERIAKAKSARSRRIGLENRIESIV